MSTMETTAGPRVQRLDALPGLQALRRRPLADFAHCAGVACGRATLLVASDSAAVVREVEHYIPLTPWSSSTAHWEVVSVLDPALEEAIRQVARATGETAYAKRDLSYHSARLDDGTLLLASDESFAEHRHAIVRAGSWVAVVDAGGTEQTRRGPLRVVREVSLRGLENLGGCFGHAAAVDAAGTGCVLFGGNGSGKTSVMWNLVMQGAGYVANDRCTLLQEAGRIRVFVYPMSIRLGMGTVGDMTRLRELQLQRSQAEGLWSQRFARDDDARANWGNRDKLELTPRELTELTGAPVSLEGAADVVVFPRLEIGAGPVRLCEVSRAAAEGVLRENLREPVDEDFMRGFLDAREVSDAFLVDRQEELLQALLELPRFRVEGDPRSLRGAAPELFRELSALGPAERRGGR
jgi:hypothetical protein